MGIVFDLILVLLIVISVLVGRKRGLLRTLFTAGIIVIAIILANIASPYVSKGMEKLKISEKINDKIYTTINESVKEENISFDALAEKYKLPESIVASIEEKAEDIKTATGEALAKKIAEKLTTMAIKILSFIIVAAVVLILLVVISIALKIISKIPLIEKFDKAGGGIAGFALGLALAFVACLFIYFAGLSNVGGAFSKIASSSLFMKLIDKIGLIKGIINR